MPYDKDNKETAEQLRKRIDREVASRTTIDGVTYPTPEEIAERAAAIRAAYTNEKGVLKVPPCNEGGRERQKKYQPGIRVVKSPTRTGRPRPE